MIRRFAETYAQRTGTFFCSDLGVTSVVLEGLAAWVDAARGERRDGSVAAAQPAGFDPR